MFEPFLAFFGRLLGSLVSPAVGLYRQFSAERKAGENPESVRVDNADEILDAALRRIGSPSEPDSLMQDFAASTTAAYTRPDHLNKPHVRDWLALPGNSEAFKRIAKSALVGAPEPSDQRRKLISSYSAVSGEAEHLGESAVSTILAILKAAVQSSTSDSGASGIIQIGFASVHDQLKKMGKPHDSFDAQASVYFANQIIEIHRDQAREQLDKILKRRSSPRRETLSELKELSSALSIDGRLAAAPKDVKIEVHNWIARISAATGNLSEAEKSIQFIQGSGFAVSDIVLAWMNVAENKAEIALQNLRSKTDPDSRSNIFVILRRTKSLSDALTYFRSFQPHQYEHFTPFGWHAICASLLEASEYAEALEIVQWLPAETFSGCIAFGYLRGLVLALQFVPEDHRARAIDDPLAVVNHCLEGGEATEWRKRARDAFSEAQITATASSDDAVAQACEDWIRVIDFSDPATKEQTIARLRLDMMDPINAVRLIRCAITFEVSIDTTALEIHLAKLEQLGGPNGDELIATLFLLQHKNQHAEAAKFIQSRWSRLIEFARPAALAGARIEALIKAGECDSASMALEELKNFIYKPDLPRHRLMIDDCKGQDPTQRAKENFEASQAIEDLWNLVFVLRAKKRWSDLVPYARLLAKRETTAEAVTILVTGLQNSNAPPKEIVAVLEHYRELIELDHNLNSIHAWALYHLGKIFQAKDINDKLLRERSAANDIGLDANIAIRLGDWDRFTDVLSAAWGRRNELPVQLTLQVAKLAGSRAPERALQLCEEAVKRDPGNPALLIRAHGIAMSLARDDLALPWIHQAAELSTDDNGPIKKLSSRAEIISMLVSQADDWRRKNELFREGKIPLHWAASMLNVPLTKLLVSIPAENRAKADARRKYPIPVRSGGRKEVDISKVKKLGLDITSVFFLSGIGLLEQTIENFEEIYLSPRVMENLLLEREKIGFHQPSRIERSKKLLELRRSGKISVAEALANSTLAVEVGPEAASLLTLAKKIDGRYIHFGQFNKINSSTETIAELGDFSEFTSSLISVAESLFIQSIITSSRRDAAVSYLEKIDNHPQPSRSLSEGTPILLDSVSAEYLLDAALLEIIRAPILVHQDAIDQWEALVALEPHTASMLESLDRIRVTLRRGLESGRVKFIQECSGDEEDEELNLLARPISDWLNDCGCADAVCFDDRIINGQMFIEDRGGQKAKIICSFDLINYLSERKVISQSKKAEILHNLRLSLYFTIPLSAEELQSYVSSQSIDQDGSLKESAELRSIREYLSRLHSAEVLQLGSDLEYMDELWRAGVSAIQAVWKSDEESLETVEARASWIYQFVIPDIEVALRFSADRERKTEEVAAARLFKILLPLPLQKRKRMAYTNWLSKKVVSEYQPGNSKIIELASVHISNWIVATMAEKIDGPKIGARSALTEHPTTGDH